MNSKPRIAVGSLGVPELGGESAVASALHEQLLDDGADSSLLNLLEPADVAYCQHELGRYGNPHRLPAVETIGLRAPSPGPRPEVAAALEKLAPDLLIGIGAGAAALLGKAAPARRLIFVATACHHLHLDRRRRRKRRSERPNLVPPLEVEEAAVSAADLVLAHSTSARRALAAHFPSYEGKLADEVLWLADWVERDVERYEARKRVFAERELDVLFVARSWKEPRANRELMLALAERNRGLRLHVVGDGGDAAPGGFWPEARREQLLELMGTAKVVVLTHGLASAPFALYEATAMGCNVVASRGCGNRRFANPQLIAPSNDPDAFSDAIRLALAAPLAGEVAPSSHSYETLVQIAAVL